MSLSRHSLLCGFAACFVMACGSKDKDAEAAPDTAAGETEGGTGEPEGGEGVDAGATGGAEKTAVESAGSPENDRAKTLRERRAERLVRKAGDETAAEDGPKVARPARVGAELGKKPPLLAGTAAEPVKPGMAKGEKGEKALAIKGEGDTGDVAAEDPAIDAPGEETPAKPEDPAKDGAEAARARHEADRRAAAGRVALPSPDVARFLPLAVVSDLTQKKGLRDAGSLPGIASVDGYGSVFYASPDKRFGVSLQAWADPTLRETEDRYRRMRLQHPGAEDVEALKPVKAYYAEFAGIQSLTLARPDKLMVLTVSCGDRTCDHTALLKLAQSVQARL